MAAVTSRAPRVVFCWTDVSGYIAACWRALAARGVDVHVLQPRLLFPAEPNPFREDEALLDGIPNELFDSNAPDVVRFLRQRLAAIDPDVIVLCGWLYWPYVRAALAPEFRKARVIVGMDSPWRGTWGQRLARVRLSALVSRLDAVVCAGDRSRDYARRLGVPEARIWTGYYGFDDRRFTGAAVGPRPRQFLYVGRFVPQKDLATLAKAYAIYRAGVADPWGLSCHGDGVDAPLLAGVDGLTNAGFTPPRDLPAVFARHGAFVMASRFEPWGVVIAEAAASGLPIVCTTAVGAGADIVRDYYNGVTVAPGDPAGLARALRWVHDHEADLPAMGQRSQALAAPFGASVWAARWQEYLAAVMGA